MTSLAILVSLLFLSAEDGGKIRLPPAQKESPDYHVPPLPTEFLSTRVQGTPASVSSREPEPSGVSYQDPDVVKNGWEYYKKRGKLPEGMSAREFCRKFQPYLQDSDPEERANAVDVLATVVPASDIELLDAIKDPSPLVRKRAAAALAFGRWTGSLNVTKLIELLSDPDEQVRVEAMLSLGHHGYLAECAIPALVRMVLNDQESSVIRANAANAITHIDSKVARIPWSIEYLAKSHKWESSEEFLKVLHDRILLAKYISLRDIQQMVEGHAPACGPILALDAEASREFIDGSEEPALRVLYLLDFLEVPELIPTQWVMDYLRDESKAASNAILDELVSASLRARVPSATVHAAIAKRFRDNEIGTTRHAYLGCLLVQIDPRGSEARRYLSEPGELIHCPIDCLMKSSNPFVAAVGQREMRKLIHDGDTYVATNWVLRSKNIPEELIRVAGCLLYKEKLNLTSEELPVVTAAVMKAFRKKLPTALGREYENIRLEIEDVSDPDPKARQLLSVLALLGEEADAKWIAELIGQTSKPRTSYAALCATRSYVVMPNVVHVAVSQMAESENTLTRLIAAERLLMSDPQSTPGLKVLRDELASPDFTVRYACLQRIRDLPCSGLRINKLAEDRSAAVRNLAISLGAHDARINRPNIAN